MTDARTGGEDVEVLLDPTSPTSRAGGADNEVLVIPAPVLRIHRVGGHEVNVLIPSRHLLVAVGAPLTPLQIRWPDGTWHQMRAMA